MHVHRRLSIKHNIRRYRIHWRSVCDSPGCACIIVWQANVLGNHWLATYQTLAISSELTSCPIGAKLINPFGILSGCHSQDFRRRLRERYHCQSIGENGHSTDDPSDVIRMNAFLRDFVIDFGPADIDEDSEHGRKVVEGDTGGRSEVEHNAAGHATGTHDA